MKFADNTVSHPKSFIISELWFHEEFDKFCASSYKYVYRLHLRKCYLLRGNAFILQANVTQFYRTVGMTAVSSY
jgi:hypothetical protein